MVACLVNQDSHSFDVGVFFLGVVGEVGGYLLSDSFVYIIASISQKAELSSGPFSSYRIFCCKRRLGDVLSSLTSKKDVVPYENSMLTQILGDSLGIQFPSCIYGGSYYGLEL